MSRVQAVMRLIFGGRRGIVFLGVLVGFGWRLGVPHSPVSAPLPRPTAWSAGVAPTVTEQLESGAIRIGPATNPGAGEAPNEGAPAAVPDNPASAEDAVDAAAKADRAE